MALFLRYPTAVNSSRNVGDIYWYQSGVKPLIVSDGYNNGASDSGLLAFAVNQPLTATASWLGSSGTRTATNSSRNVGDIYAYQSGVRLSGAGGGYVNGTNDSGPLDFHVYYPLTFSGAGAGPRSSGTHSID